MTSSSLTVQGPGAIARPGRSPFAHSHLKFHLSLQTPALISTRSIQEAITIAAQRVTPMPNMPPCMLGLINRRSRVIWVADLALLLGLPVAYPNSQQYKLILLQSGPVLVALRVLEIDSIISVTPDQIQPPPAHVSANLVPYLQGCLLQASEILLLLNAEAILAAPALHSSYPPWAAFLTAPSGRAHPAPL